ncbi:MAG: PAS domain S-box protein [Candidatus Omnitrophota bacterium]
MLHKIGEVLSLAKDKNRLFGFLPAIPLVILIVTVPILYILRAQEVYEPKWLLPQLNSLLFVFALTTCFLAAAGFLSNGRLFLLMLGSGACAFGSACFLGGLFVLSNNLNAAVTAHNLITCLAGLFHLTAAFLMANSFSNFVWKKKRLLILSHALTLTIIAVLAFASWKGYFPPFFLKGTATFARTVVLTASVCLFLQAGLFLALIARRDGFLKYYFLGLVSIGAGLIIVSLSGIGSPFSWTGRLAQLLGQFYILIFLLLMLRKPGTSELSIGQKLEKSFQRLEQALRKSEEKYKDLVENSASIIMTTDRDLNITYMNEYGLKFFGYTAAELIGKNVIGTTIPQKDDMGRDLASMAREIKDRPGKYRTNVHKNMRKDGSLVWVSWTNKARYDKDGNLAEILAVGNDITHLKKIESSLRESEERFRAFMDNSPGAAWIKDEEGRYVYLSKGYEERCGMKTKDWMGKTDFQLWPEVAQAFRRNDLEVLRDGKTRQVLEKSRLADGSPAFWLNSKFLIYDAEARKYVAGTGVDITNQKRNEEELIRLASFPLLNPQPVVEVDLEGHVFFSNPAAEKLFDDLEKQGRSHPWLWQWPEIIASFLEKGQRHCEREVQAGERWYYQFLYFMKETNRVRIYGMDITERKKAEEAIRAAQWELARGEASNAERKRLFYVLEMLPVYVILLTEDYHIFFANKFFRERFKVTEGKKCFESLFRRDSACDNCQTYNPFKTGVPHQWSWMGPDDRHYDIHDFLFKDSDGKKYILEMGIDVTKQKKAQEELLRAQEEIQGARRLADIGTLASTVAHELRNPLAAIGMASMNIRRKVKDSRCDSHLVNIQKKLDEGERIINNLLFYSKIRPPQRESINLRQVIEECLGLVQKQKKKKISLKKDMRALEDLEVYADPGQIKEVFYNVFNNAFDAVGETGGEITVSAEISDGQVKSIIKDNGIGIEKSNLDRIFDPFFSTKAKGTGLGLTVCRQIVNFHGGRIEIESEPGKGTAVKISLLKKAIQSINQSINQSG